MFGIDIVNTIWSFLFIFWFLGKVNGLDVKCEKLVNDHDGVFEVYLLLFAVLILPKGKETELFLKV